MKHKTQKTWTEPYRSQPDYSDKGGCGSSAAKLLILALLFAILLAACDDQPVNPGTYPCNSQIAPCVTPAP